MKKPPQDPELGSTKTGRRKKRQQLLKEIILDFAKNTTLHGLRYVAEKGVTIVEKAFWVVTFVVSLGLCVFLINNVWVKWRASPVIVTLSEHLVSVGEVPFPAVTICPQAKIYRKYFDYKAAAKEFGNITKHLYYLSKRSNQAYETFKKAMPSFEEIFHTDHVCAESSLFINTIYFEAPKYTDYNLPKNIMKASPKTEDIFKTCKWRSNRVKCIDIFDPVVTSEGVCFTFNSLAANEIFRMDKIQQEYAYLNSSIAQRGWSFQRGYPSDEEDSYPRRGRGSVSDPDLDITFQELASDQEDRCNTFREGYKVFLHQPSDLAQSSLYYFAALPGQLSSIALKYSILNTSESLASYPPQVRQCYFPMELQLKYFRSYTPSNCRLECLSDFTFQRCGCVWFHMPHNDSSFICTWGSRQCVSRAMEEFTAKDRIRSNKVGQCVCLPTCTSITYDAEILKTSFDKNKYMKVMFPSHMWNPDLRNSKIEMYFKETQFVSMRRSELFGLTDFLANCGGLLGLFLGFSFLSLVEIFYFCTLRYVHYDGLTDFLDNCDGLLELFLGFSFLRLVEIFYFCTLRLCCIMRKFSSKEEADNTC